MLTGWNFGLPLSKGDKWNKKWIEVGIFPVEWISFYQVKMEEPWIVNCGIAKRDRWKCCHTKLKLAGTVYRWSFSGYYCNLSIYTYSGQCISYVMLMLFPFPKTVSELSCVIFDITFWMLLLSSSLSLKLASRGLPTVFTMLPSLSVAMSQGSFNGPRNTLGVIDSIGDVCSRRSYISPTWHVKTWLSWSQKNMELYKNKTWTDEIYTERTRNASEAAATFLNCLAFPKKYLSQDTFPLGTFLN